MLSKHSKSLIIIATLILLVGCMSPTEKFSEDLQSIVRPYAKSSVERILAGEMLHDTDEAQAVYDALSQMDVPDDPQAQECHAAALQWMENIAYWGNTMSNISKEAQYMENFSIACEQFLPHESE